MNSLDDLFRQIIHTEQRAQQRRNFLNEVKLNVQTLKEKVKEADRECISFKGQLATKIQKLTEEEFSYKLLQHKQETLFEQLNISSVEFKELQNQANILIEQKYNETDSFCAEVDEFAEDYSLSSDGRARREKGAKAEISNLQKQYEHLKTVQANYIQKKHSSDSLEKRLLSLNNEKERLERNLQELKFKLEEEKKITGEKENILNTPASMPEFKRLQQQLDVFKQENLEEKCTELQKELRHLQQLVWQKQVKERQHVQDKKRQNLRQKKQDSSIQVTNRMQLSNFTAEPNTSTSAQTDSTIEEADLFTEDYTSNVSHQKFLFKSHSGK